MVEGPSSSSSAGAGALGDGSGCGSAGGGSGNEKRRRRKPKIETLQEKYDDGKKNYFVVWILFLLWSVLFLVRLDANAHIRKVGFLHYTIRSTEKS